MIWVMNGDNEFQKARLSLIAFLYGSEDQTESIEVEDTLLRSLIANDLDHTL